MVGYMLIYLLEDDDSIRNFVAYALNNSGMESRGFAQPEQFWTALFQEMPDLVLLDIMLPGEDGMEILKKLRSRQETVQLPVIMLTAKSTEYDRVLGLDSGADDYICKPFGIMELLSRIKALLRRAKPESEEKAYTVGGLYVVLTLKEFELLCLFISHPGTVFTRDQILQKIWGFEFDGENRTVDVHIRTLRTKLGECGEQIETVRGIGYKISG